MSNPRGIIDRVNKAELARFLRSRREALQPVDVGLARGSRRRTAGLRREEVAALADMSADYYGRLEQQRAAQPSLQILGAIARALRLSSDERDHLFRLAGHYVPDRVGPEDHVSPALMRLLDLLDDTPALVMTDLGQTLAQNRMAVALLGNHSHHQGAARSVVYRWFTDPEARRRYPREDHALESASLVSDLRATLARHGPGGDAGRLVESLLAASKEFSELWNKQGVAVRRSGDKRILHPEVGLMELHCQALLAEQERQILATFTASPGSTSAQNLALLSVIGQQQFQD
jgi:transcriptional regulator with XRE-family HTH domain